MRKIRKQKRDKKASRSKSKSKGKPKVEEFSVEYWNNIRAKLGMSKLPD